MGPRPATTAESHECGIARAALIRLAGGAEAARAPVTDQLTRSFACRYRVGRTSRAARMSGGEKPSPGLTIDRAAFLLLRVKRAFKKKRQQRKEKR